jgi:hypothetical protein
MKSGSDRLTNMELERKYSPTIFVIYCIALMPPPTANHGGICFSNLWSFLY